jgi:hypothetical protein
MWRQSLLVKIASVRLDIESLIGCIAQGALILPANSQVLLSIHHGGCSICLLCHRGLSFAYQIFPSVISLSVFRPIEKAWKNGI